MQLSFRFGNLITWIAISHGDIWNTRGFSMPGQSSRGPRSSLVYYTSLRPLSIAESIWSHAEYRAIDNKAGEGPCCKPINNAWPFCLPFTKIGMTTHPNAAWISLRIPCSLLLKAMEEGYSCGSWCPDTDFLRECCCMLTMLIVTLGPDGCSLRLAKIAGIDSWDLLWQDISMIQSIYLLARAKCNHSLELDYHPRQRLHMARVKVATRHAGKLQRTFLLALWQ